MQEKTSDDKILTAAPLVCGMLSLLSFVIYYYNANHAPYLNIDVIFLGPIFSLIGMVISIVRRKSRKTHPVLWMSGVLSCLLGFVICIMILIALVLLIEAKLNE